MKNDLEAIERRYRAHTDAYDPDTQGLMSALLSSVNDIPSLVAEVRALRAEVEVFLDKPEDRLYHAEDRSWWKRVDGRLVRSGGPETPPPSTFVSSLRYRSRLIFETLKRRIGCRPEES